MNASNATPNFPLPYAPDALEPVLSKQQILLHASLAEGYVNQFPVIQAGMASASKGSAMAFREQLRTLSFQGSGYVLHNIYFANMTEPDTGGAPGATTMELITQIFPSLADFEQAFLGAANAVEGPGWAVFGFLPATSKAYLLQCEEHNNKTIWGIIPILILDVWEHAYLLDYGTNRATYTAAWLKLINWKDVESRANYAVQNGQMPMIAPIK